MLSLKEPAPAFFGKNQGRVAAGSPRLVQQTANRGSLAKAPVF